MVTFSGQQTAVAQASAVRSSHPKEDPLKIRIALIVCVALIAIPAMAQTVYSNGPINGSTDAWTINFGFVVSDTFTTSGGTVSGLNFGAWTFPGDVLQSAEVQITSAEFGGTTFF